MRVAISVGTYRSMNPISLRWRYHIWQNLFPSKSRSLMRIIYPTEAIWFSRVYYHLLADVLTGRHETRYPLWRWRNKGYKNL